MKKILLLAALIALLTSCGTTVNVWTDWEKTDADAAEVNVNVSTDGEVSVEATDGEDTVEVNAEDNTDADVTDAAPAEDDTDASIKVSGEGVDIEINEGMVDVEVK